MSVANIRRYAHELAKDGHAPHGTFIAVIRVAMMLDQSVAAGRQQPLAGYSPNHAAYHAAKKSAIGAVAFSQELRRLNR